ncbi:probable beta-hexosaminidase fdl isoform X1 [Stomoxys calcitrans]|uniref:beta-N-acetylhexosaminidase n=2 Tax=Stomoxys calcitrans TaxID=35570 RepID=A0A1I8NSW4_STOCA|nr:probable beta-hexosaminidase fdl isoform X1 [Stomoxys calcitrans]
MNMLLHVWHLKTYVENSPWLRYIFKMALAVSLRKALLMLLTAMIFVLMVLYWNQGGIKPQSYINTYEKSVGSREALSEFPIPVEKIWTYKCEGDKCVRYHYLTLAKGEKRVPFMSCSMTCGDINIWPHPTIKSGVSSKSLTFSMEDIELRLDTPYPQVESQFRQSFELFLKDLRRIQRLDFRDASSEGVMGGAAETAAVGAGSSAATASNPGHVDDVHDIKKHVQRRYVDAGQTESHRLRSENVGAASILANAFGGSRKRCDIETFTINVSVHKFSDLHLNFDTDESYRLTGTFENGHYFVQISANSFFGARHALSTLEQLIWFDDEDNLLRTLSKVIIIDAPKFRYRGLMLDTSRHFFSVEAIKRTIAGMSHAKLNRFHWHITDSQSFPYVSKHYPELAAHGAYSERETYTDADVRDIVGYAKLHGIQVIPEIDAPAHAGNGWDWGPKRGMGELSLCINQQPWSFYCGEPPCGQLNPKNNHTYLILQRLYEELLNSTGPTDYFHLGGDEVNLECWAQYFNDTDLRGLWCDFMMNAMARLKIANNNVEPKYVTVWSSGLTNTRCLPKSQFAVQVWGGSTWQENYDLLDNGFNVIFSHVDAWYLDCGFGNWRATGDAACSPYRTWQNVYKHRPWERMRLDKTRRKQVLGGEVCLWTEQVDEEQLDNRLWPRASALGERLWADPDDVSDMDTVPQEVFKRMSVFRTRLVELGLKAEPIFPKYCAQNPGECI